MTKRYVGLWVLLVGSVIGLFEIGALVRFLMNYPSDVSFALGWSVALVGIPAYGLVVYHMARFIWKVRTA